MEYGFSAREEEAADAFQMDLESAAGRARKSISTPNLQTLHGGKPPILDPDEMNDNASLFFQPGKIGFYSPIAGKNSAERLNAFRNVGR